MSLVGHVRTAFISKTVDFLSGWSRYLKLYRVPMLIFAGLLFVSGSYWSFQQVGISPAELKLGPLTILACLMVPSLLYGGLGLNLLARSARLSIPLGKASVIAAYAYLAEMLPIPGGAIIRATALMKAGGSLQRSSALVLLTAILWISLAMLGTGLALLQTHQHLAVPALLVGGGSAIPIFGWLWSTAGIAIAVQTLLHRIAGIALMAVRLQFAFAVLHTSIDFTQTLPFALASLIGSASSIAPAGLGVSESLAALTATVSAYPPSTAFLAVGIDRLLSLVACACVALFTQLRRPNEDSHPTNVAESGSRKN
jgi:uncharacterized membrane protein YbhN (UPF0104 family)